MSNILKLGPDLPLEIISYNKEFDLLKTNKYFYSLAKKYKHNHRFLIDLYNDNINSYFVSPVSCTKLKIFEIPPEGNIQLYECIKNKYVTHLKTNTYVLEYISQCNFTNLTYLDCSNTYYGKVPKDIKPINFTSYIPTLTKLKSLILDEKFNKDISFLTSLESLTLLKFGNQFNQIVDNLLPPNLEHLTFGFRFNQEVNHLPNNLKYLVFGSKFNKKVDNLPESLLDLKFGYEFNQRIDHLPSKLINLF